MPPVSPDSTRCSSGNRSARSPPTFNFTITTYTATTPTTQRITNARPIHLLLPRRTWFAV